MFSLLCITGFQAHDRQWTLGIRLPSAAAGASPQSVHHLVNVGDVQLVPHRLNLIFSGGLDRTVRAWSEREKTGVRRSPASRIWAPLPVCFFLTCFCSLSLRSWNPSYESRRGDWERSPPSRVCTETWASHRLWIDNSADRKRLWISAVLIFLFFFSLFALSKVKKKNKKKNEVMFLLYAEWLSGAFISINGGQILDLLWVNNQNWARFTLQIK